MIVGHVGQDPSCSNLDNGKKRSEFSVATKHTFKNKTTGEKEEQTDWHRIECWSGLAEIVEKYVKQGLQVYVEGRQRHTTYEKEGETKTRSYIYAHEIKILTKKEQ